jgi:quinol monooxygenase YgiN
MIRVLATIELHPGRQAEFLRIFHELVPKVAAEKGCRDYLPMLDVETNIGTQIPLRADVVTVVETWADIESLENHLIAPHMREYRKAVKDLVARVSLQVLQPA